MSNYKHYPSPRNNGDTGTYAKEEGVNCNANEDGNEPND
jgi:hypothetical protein